MQTTNSNDELSKVSAEGLKRSNQMCYYSDYFDFIYGYKSSKDSIYILLFFPSKIAFVFFSFTFV